MQDIGSTWVACLKKEIGREHLKIIKMIDNLSDKEKQKKSVPIGENLLLSLDKKKAFLKDIISNTPPESGDEQGHENEPLSNLGRA